MPIERMTRAEAHLRRLEARLKADDPPPEGLAALVAWCARHDIHAGPPLESLTDAELTEAISLRTGADGLVGLWRECLEAELARRTRAVE